MKLPIKQLGFILSSFLLFLFITIYPSFSYAAFESGINIGPHTNKTQNALSSISDSGWVYILIQPTQEDKNTLSRLLKEYPNAKFIIRGHTPDNQGNSLTSTYAQNWNSFFTGLPLLGGRIVYFVPVNEPNNPDESQNSQGVGGIPSQTVKNYINALRSAGLFDNPKVKVLSPAMDVFNLADGSDYQSSQNYANQLKGPNGEDFFSQFDGISLNLYGQFNGNQIDGSAPDIKRGLKYREFMRDYLGIPQNIAATMPVFAVETGVLKVNEGIKYEPFANDIATYLNSVSDKWGSDNNFIMYSIFSYDPAIQPPTHWIFNNVTVLQAMGHTVQYIVTPIPTGTQLQPTPESGIIPQISTDDALGKLYNITQRSNVRLLPHSVQEKNRQLAQTIQCKGKLGIVPICLLGTEVVDSDQSKAVEDLTVETNKFQPVYVPESKVVNVINIARECGPLGCLADNIADSVTNFLLGKVITPQMSDKPTGSLNTYRPSNLNFSAPQTENVDSQVLAETSNPEKETVDSYEFTQKMLLPHSIGNANLISPTSIPITGEPSVSPSPQVTPPIAPIASTLKDPDGSNELKQLISEVSKHFQVPQAVIASISWIEGAHIWYYDDAKISQYTQPGAKDPKNCQENPWTAAGPMQFTRHQWEPPPPAYKEAVKEAFGQQNREGNRCNIMDAFWGASKKLKNDSFTGNSTSLSWNKAAVANAGYRYYGLCGKCPLTKGDPELNLGGTDLFACIRFLGKSYCEYMWDYYQCNDNSETTEEFISCAKSKGLETGVRKF